MIGHLVYSMAGHDKNKVYAVIQEDSDYVWLADGDIRTIDHLKKKNKKHVQLIKYELSGDTVTNEMIKRTIKLYCLYTEIPFPDEVYIQPHILYYPKLLCIFHRQPKK